MSVESPLPATWAARPHPAATAAPWAALAAATVAAMLAGLALGQEPGTAMLASLGAAALAGLGAGVLGLAALGYRRLAYVLEEDDLVVRWLAHEVRLPYAAVSSVESGRRLAGGRLPRWIGWPMLRVGAGRVRGIGRLRFYVTTGDPSHLLLVRSRTSGLVLAPADPDGFRAALLRRLPARSDDELPQNGGIHLLPLAHAPWSALGDAWLPWAVGAALLLVLGTVAVLTSRFGLLPDRIPLRFDATREPSDMGLRGELFRLPVSGLLVLAFNAILGVWLHPRQPVLARALWVTAAIVQATLLVAMLRLTQ